MHLRSDALDDLQLTRLATAAVVAAFGAVLVMPAIKEMHDRTILWWLSYVVLVATVTSGGNVPASREQRICIAGMAVLMPLLYVWLIVAVLERDYHFSGAAYGSPTFVKLMLAFTIGTWIFTWLFSYANELFERLVLSIDGQATEEKIKRVTKNITLFVSLISAFTLLLSKVL
jgi:hypothetical protein